MSRVLSDDFNALEDGAIKNPSEIYHFWCGSNHWYYTSYDERILFHNIYYEPASIGRSPVEYRVDLNISKLNILIGLTSHPVMEYIAKNPVDIVWIQVTRLFNDQDDDEGSVIFIGQIKTASFKGVESSVECVGFENYLKQPIPKERYQSQCNHVLFDTGCTVDDSTYKVSDVSVTIDATKRILIATEFGAEDDGYWTFGRIEYEGYGRMILAHNGNTITLAYPLWKMPTSGGLIDIWPGCDRNVETCRDKFDNVINFFGFPYMPFDNPALWR